jgi:predicted transcriptional regulator
LVANDVDRIDFSGSAARMPPSKSTTLTEAELRLMDVFWRKDSATVQQILDALPEKPALAYNSVLTTVRVLETKGYLKHEKDGRAHVYSPIVGRKEASRLEVQRLVHRFFGNSHEQLVLNVIEDENLDARELRRLRQLLDGGE